MTESATVAFLIGLYLLPAIVAAARHHHQAGAIFVLNLFLGWTFLGWVAAMVWSSTAVVLLPQRGVSNPCVARRK